MKRDEFQAEPDRIDRQRRGDPLTPEDEARIHAQERRWSEGNRIRREEWSKARGFPYYPIWFLPVAGCLAGMLLVPLITALAPLGEDR
jgi:hypothetical protein